MSLNEKYKEPVDGKFEDATNAILERLKGDGSEDEDSDGDLEDYY